MAQNMAGGLGQRPRYSVDLFSVLWITGLWYNRKENLEVIKPLQAKYKFPSEGLRQLLLRVKGARKMLKDVYGHKVRDLERIPKLESALSGEIKTSFITWCGLKGATYQISKVKFGGRSRSGMCAKQPWDYLPWIRQTWVRTTNLQQQA